MKVLLIDDEGVARLKSVEPGKDNRPPRYIDVPLAERPGVKERYIRSVVISQSGRPIYVLHEVKV